MCFGTGNRIEKRKMIINLKENLIKILAEAHWLRNNYRIGLEDCLHTLTNIIQWTEECLSQLEDGKK